MSLNKTITEKRDRATHRNVPDFDEGGGTTNASTALSMRLKTGESGLTERD